jgi:iron only hydrogenase large subunit-like protein
LLQPNQQQQQRLPSKVLRNAHIQELQLLGPGGQPLLRFATAYGFRNIQSLVRKMKMGRCEYDYVEVMACPSGCLNGGGQLKAPAGISSAAHIELLFFRQLTVAAVQQQQLEDAQHQQQQQQQQRYIILLGVHTAAAAVAQLVAA